MLLRFLNAAARHLQPLRVFIWLLLVVSIVGFGTVIVGAFGMGDRYAILFLVLCLWCLSLLVVVTCFPRQPAAILSSDGLGVRVRKHMDRGLTWLIAIVTVLVTIAVAITTLRLGAVFFGGLTN